MFSVKGSLEQFAFEGWEWGINRGVRGMNIFQLCTSQTESSNGPIMLENGNFIMLRIVNLRATSIIHGLRSIYGRAKPVQQI